MSDVATPEVAAVIVMAAGQGTRMKSTLPKVLHAIAGRSLVGHALAASRSVSPERLVVLVDGSEQVAAHLAAEAPDAQLVVQQPRNGTGHAARVALTAIDAALSPSQLSGTVLITSGDTPLLRGATLQALAAARAKSAAAAVLLTSIVADPTGYGRVVRDAEGNVSGIVEHRDADEAQRQIREINTGTYAFDAAALRGALPKLSTDNAQGEEYLVDVVGMFTAAGLAVGTVHAEDVQETLGVNDRVQLSQAGAILRDRINEQHMRNGVTLVDPASTWIEVGVTIEPDAMILPGVLLEGSTSVATGAVVGPGGRLRDTVVGPHATVAETTATGAEIGEGASVGPFTYLRPGTKLGRHTRAGAYVEMKGAVVGDGSKVPHLSYVGDAIIGEGTNIGAATIFVNYDGVAKHRTTVGDQVRIGSDTMLVAPLTVGDGAYTAAGSVITEDVPPGAMAIARGQQRNVEGWVAKRRPGSSSAQAAEAARGDGSAPDA